MGVLAQTVETLAKHPKARGLLPRIRQIMGFERAGQLARARGKIQQAFKPEVSPATALKKLITGKPSPLTRGGYPAYAEEAYMRLTEAQLKEIAKGIGAWTAAVGAPLYAGHRTVEYLKESVQKRAQPIPPPARGLRRLYELLTFGRAKALESMIRQGQIARQAWQKGPATTARQLKARQLIRRTPVIEETVLEAIREIGRERLKGLGLQAAGVGLGTVGALAGLEAARKEGAEQKTVGVFLRVPRGLGGKFPDKEEDSSPAHATLLYVGKVDDKQHDKVVSAVRDVAKKVAPFRVELTDYGEFSNDKGQTIPHMIPRSHGTSLEELHGLLRKAVEKRKVPIEHRDGPFKSHVTLGYVPKGKRYEGPRPSGTFTVKDLEAWLSRGDDHSERETVRIPLQGRRKQAIDPSMILREIVHQLTWPGGPAQLARLALTTAPITAPAAVSAARGIATIGARTARGLAQRFGGRQLQLPRGPLEATGLERMLLGTRGLPPLPAEAVRAATKAGADPSPDKLSTKPKSKAPDFPPTAPHPAQASIAAAATKGQYRPVKVPIQPKYSQLEIGAFASALGMEKEAISTLVKALAAAGLLGTAFLSGREHQRIRAGEQQRGQRQSAMRRRILERLYGVPR